ncbi:MAG: ACT domain-containing protein [Oscillospiraceae bacterium]
MNDNQMLLISAEVLPPVFLKVIHAKELIASGEARSASDAAKASGISRSAFYKYKECVFKFDNHFKGRIVTVHSVLRDKAGALSQLLSKLCDSGANILTVNQGIPSSGVASVSISFRTERITTTIDELLGDIKSCDSVVSIKQILGE